ncbi:MAG: undecaprenyl-diphosphatase UppP [Nitrospiraceae bacterium]|nr:undecaprenyl-diphosphatase UppP [Nitrospiraceae bacterium]
MIEAIILGIIQGATEFLPVSSTAHLILLPWFFNWSGEVNTLTFDVALHAGTLLALLACFYKDWVEIFSNNRKLLLLLVIGTIPAAILGLLFHHQIENNLRLPAIIAATLIIFAIIMLISEKFRGEKDVKQISLKDAVIIGLCQAIALIPGVSRSGITISAGLFSGMKRDEAARFSFLLSTPAVFGATLLEGKKLVASPDNYDLKLFIVGLAVSAIAGFAVIKFLMHFFRKHTLNVFVYYRFILAATILGALWLKK